jgi:hypothetical protein
MHPPSPRVLRLPDDVAERIVARGADKEDKVAAA